jgi:hypothetical protein
LSSVCRACSITCVNGHSFLSCKKEQNHGKKESENTEDVQGELIDQLLRESSGPQALFDKGGLDGRVSNKAVYLALSITMEGQKV